MMFYDIEIEIGFLNYFNMVMGYRVIWNGRSVVYCFDIEYFFDCLDENVVYLVRGVDVLIYDVMYIDDEYYSFKFFKVGWGYLIW